MTARSEKAFGLMLRRRTNVLCQHWRRFSLGALVLTLLVAFGAQPLSAEDVKPIATSIKGKRPGDHPQFKAGVKLFDKIPKHGAVETESWLEVTRHMRDALARWPEDGELVRVQGRWFVAYLPHYYLGVALHQMGCFEDAAKQLKTSLVSQRKVKGANREARDLQARLEKCEDFVGRGINEAEDADCETWQSNTFVEDEKDGPGD